MLKIRLLRGGAKKRPFYRIVAIDERRKRDGRAVEFLGTYDPKTDPATIRMDVERVDRLVERGAQMSHSVAQVHRRAREQAAAQPPPAQEAGAGQPASPDAGQA